MIKVVALVIFLSFSAQCERDKPVHNDESGTLVVIAKADDGLIVSTDSKISGGSSDVDGSRKIVAVGHQSACVLSGYLGIKRMRLDVAASMRAWVKNHPTMEAPEALGALVDEAKSVWDSEFAMLGGDALDGRRPGSEITLVYCGVYSKSRANIMFADTYVGKDSRAVVDASRPPIMERVLIGGEITGSYISPLLGSVPVVVQQTPRRVWLAEAVRRDAEVQRRLDYFGKIEKDGSRRWNSKDASMLLAALFRVTESTVPDIVAPPNVAYLLRRCGRTRLTVESVPPDQTCRSESPKRIIGKQK